MQEFRTMMGMDTVTLDPMHAGEILADHFCAKSTEDQFSRELFLGVILVDDQDGQASMQKYHSFTVGCRKLSRKLTGKNNRILRRSKTIGAAEKTESADQ